MILIANRRAKAEYEVLKQFQAGIVLSGPEVKSLRNKSGSLHGSFVKIISGEAFLMNCQITPYKFADNKEYDPKRSRKLLLHNAEISQLMEAERVKGRTLVPLSLELVRNNIKLNFAIAKGKKLTDRRRELKERDLKREAEKALKRY